MTKPKATKRPKKAIVAKKKAASSAKNTNAKSFADVPITMTRAQKSAARPRTAMGAFIYARRNELNILTSDLAKKLGVTPQAVHAWENTAKFGVPLKYLAALALAFKIDVEKLYRVQIDQIQGKFGKVSKAA